MGLPSIYSFFRPTSNTPSPESHSAPRPQMTCRLASIIAPISWCCIHRVPFLYFPMPRSRGRAGVFIPAFSMSERALVPTKMSASAEGREKGKKEGGQVREQGFVGIWVWRVFINIKNVTRPIKLSITIILQVSNLGSAWVKVWIPLPYA